jgi:hypothetical protein
MLQIPLRSIMALTLVVVGVEPIPESISAAVTTACEPQTFNSSPHATATTPIPHDYQRPPGQLYNG